jgi:transcriptional regulator with XRE-family HTH domain
MARPLASSPEDSSTLGQRLRRIRVRRELRQEDLATLVGKPQASISAYEADRQSPSFETLRGLAGALHTSVAVLAGELPDTEAPVLDQQLTSFQVGLQALPPEQAQDLLEAVNVMLMLRLRRIRLRSEALATGIVD